MRFVYLGGLLIGPKIEDRVRFLPSSPKFSQREYTSYVFKVCCLCLGRVVPTLPAVSLDWPDKNAAGVDFSDVIESLQSFLLGSISEEKFFTSVGSISSCVELLNDFGETALQPG